MRSSPEQITFDEGRLKAFQVEQVLDPHIFEFCPMERANQPAGSMLASQPNLLIYEDHGVYHTYRGMIQNGWENASAQGIHDGKNHRILCKLSDGSNRVASKTVLESLMTEHLIAHNKGYILHCSYIVHNGKSILFTAPSQTGKSTQAELWREHRGARIINGDRAAVRIVDGEPMAEGIPFAGSSQFCLNESWPLAAIVYLGQAEETTIRKLKGGQAFSRVWEGCTVNVWDKKDVELVTNSVMQTVSQVPVFRLECTPDESAVKALEAML